MTEVVHGDWRTVEEKERDIAQAKALREPARLGIAAMNADAAREVWETARNDHRSARA